MQFAYSFNADVLRLANVKNGRIILPGGASYGVLVIPGADKMNPNGGSLSKVASGYINKLVAKEQKLFLIISKTAPSIVLLFRILLQQFRINEKLKE